MSLSPTYCTTCGEQLRQDGACETCRAKRRKRPRKITAQWNQSDGTTEEIEMDSDALSPALSPDLVAMETVRKALGRLSPEERARVLSYAMQTCQRDHDRYASMADELFQIASELHVNGDDTRS